MAAKDLAQARQANEKAHFEEVVRVLRGADVSVLSAADKADAEYLLGMAELALAHDALSQKAFARLFTEFPDYALPPYTAPKVVAACERARKQVAVVLRSERDGHLVRVCGEGLPQRADVRVTFTSSIGEQAGVIAKVPPCFSAAIPESARQYYVLVAVDGEVRAKAGSREAPLALGENAVAPSGTPWFKKWWPWAIAGGVVVLGATAAIVGVEVAHSHDPGTVRFTITQP